MDSRDDEDHEEFLSNKHSKHFYTRDDSYNTDCRTIFGYSSDRFLLHFHRKVVHEQVVL
jgi:hypothetical protein